MTREVWGVHRWPSNAHMIADVAKLGYLDGHVLDLTYGEGTFWKVWRPTTLWTNDLYKPAQYAYDYQNTPWRSGSFDSVVLDTPYKMNGTPTGDQMDERYDWKRDRERTPDQIMCELCMGAAEAARLARRYVLVKCQDQVCGGKVRWQTDVVTSAMADRGHRKVDRFDFVTVPRPQPDDRRQVTARRNASQLLVFEVGR